MRYRMHDMVVGVEQSLGASAAGSAAAAGHAESLDPLDPHAPNTAGVTNHSTRKAYRNENVVMVNSFAFTQLAQHLGTIVKNRATQLIARNSISI